MTERRWLASAFVKFFLECAIASALVFHMHLLSIYIVPIVMIGLIAKYNAKLPWNTIESSSDCHTFSITFTCYWERLNFCHPNLSFETRCTKWKSDPKSGENTQFKMCEHISVVGNQAPWVSRNICSLNKGCLGHVLESRKSRIPAGTKAFKSRDRRELKIREFGKCWQVPLTVVRL